MFLGLLANDILHLRSGSLGPHAHLDHHHAAPRHHHEAIGAVQGDVARQRRGAFDHMAVRPQVRHRAALYQKVRIRGPFAEVEGFEDRIGQRFARRVEVLLRHDPGLDRFPRWRLPVPELRGRGHLLGPRVPFGIVTLIIADEGDACAGLVGHREQRRP